MKLAIVGSRTINPSYYQYMNNILELFIATNKKPTLIISGGAMGADKYAEIYAKRYKIKTKIFYPNYKKYGKSAGLKRNPYIINNADFVIAFKDKEFSNGTDNSISIARNKNMNGWIVNVKTKKIKLL